MRQITILGASGFVGKRLVQKAIDNHLMVKVLIRDKSKLKQTDKLEILEGNYFDKKKLREVLTGSEAVLSTIGPPLNGRLSSDEEDNYINSLAYIIKQMKANKQTRWISISGAGIKKANENLPMARKLLRVKLKELSKSSISIKDRELQLLEQSDIDWTNIRPPMIKEDVKGVFVADENKFSGMTVDVNQLSDFMLAELTSNKWIKNAPVVGTK